ncbi:hypothetical protein [Streptomyces adelaidensis]|jgi:chromosome segregation ATPase|uniref:hypothetical protein n=1 Tax=Streptomyces adelaidensis TaxID=2796465 RepID=UPI001907113C|nr:hypothetical protein [Streptomyces adelaidensis]
MAGGQGGTGGETAYAGPIPTYFTKDEALYTKKMIIGLSHSVTGIKGDIEVIKGSLTGLAVGVTLLKADFTLVKLDEKGMTVFGRQKYTWPWVDQKKSLEEKIQRAQEKSLKSDESIQEKLTKLRLKIESLDAKRSQVSQLTAQARNSPDRAGLERQAHSLQGDIGMERYEAQKIRKEIDKEIEKISKNRLKIATARREMRDLATAGSASDKAREQISKNANAVRRELSQLASAL